MASVEQVTVRGGGVFGLTCAFTLLRRGAHVQVVEPHFLGAGASGGTVGALAPHTPGEWSEKKRFQFDSLLAAEAFWADVARISGIDPGYARLGRIQVLADQRAVDLAHAREDYAKQSWGTAAVWQVRPVTDFAFAPLSPTGFVAYDTLSARVAPRAACRALADAIVALGGTIVADAPDQGVVLHATGVQGLHDLTQAFGQFLGHGEKGQSALLRHDARNAPQIYTNGVHIVPHADGTVGIGSTTEREFDDPTTVDQALGDVIARARALCPALADAVVIDRWASARPRSVTRGPLLGPWPGREGHFVANGGFKIGFGLAPAIAEVMADLILTGQDRIPDDFRLSAAIS